MIDFTVCQLVGYGHTAVPVFSAEASSASVSFCCVTTTPQLDSSQTATSLAPGSRPFLLVLAYLGISDPLGFTKAHHPPEASSVSLSPEV